MFIYGESTHNYWTGGNRTLNKFSEDVFLLFCILFVYHSSLHDCPIRSKRDNSTTVRRDIQGFFFYSKFENNEGSL